MRARSVIGLGILSLLFVPQALLAEGQGEDTKGEWNSAMHGVSAARILESGATEAVIRPSAPLGIFVSAYLAQGIFLPVQSASIGIDAQRKLIAAQGNAASDETFALLQEFGNVLQVDVSDILNRSMDRRRTLDDYLQSLHNVYVLAERKITELEESATTLEDEEREKRKSVSDLERTIKKAMDEEDYTSAGSRQKELSDAQGELAKVTTKREQAEDIADRFKKLLKIAQHRIMAVESNRLILIAGLKVIQIPGIEDLRILQTQGRGRSRVQSDGTSIIGSEKLRGE